MAWVSLMHRAPVVVEPSRQQELVAVEAAVALRPRYREEAVVAEVVGPPQTILQVRPTGRAAAGEEAAVDLLNLPVLLPLALLHQEAAVAEEEEEEEEEEEHLPQSKWAYPQSQQAVVVAAEEEV